MNQDQLQLSLFSKALAGGMQSYDRLVNLSYLLFQTAEVPGAVCELGVYHGFTAALLASLKPKDKGIWLYDSFDGLSAPGPHDLGHPPFIKGAMKSHPDIVRAVFDDHGLFLDVLHQSPLENLTGVSNAICFAHCDLDLYEPTLKALGLVWPLLSKGGIIVIDDYNHPELPGVKKAVTQWQDQQWKFALTQDKHREYPESSQCPELNQPLGINGQPSLHAWIQK